MMPALDFNSTYQPSYLEKDSERVTIARSGSDLRSPAHVGNVSYLRLVGSSSITEAPVGIRSWRSPWLVQTISLIDQHRGLGAGWDGADALPPGDDVLNTAEMLAVFFNNDKSWGRPSFAVDALGRPTFAVRVPQFYLHLTVDRAERLTWYAEVNGEDHFHEDVMFSGRKLPDELSAILG
jgi:hypothetical protein